MSLDRLLDPSSIAVVGASTEKGKIGQLAMANARQFEGPVYPINPNRDEIEGEACFDRLSAIDEPVDLALLCVPPGALPKILEDCEQADVGGAVLYAAGFSEVSEEGARRERDLVALAAEHDVRLLGPNTSGFINPERRVYASFVSDLERIPTGPVSVIAQSGGINHVVTFLAAADGPGIAKAIGLGNAADIGFETLIRHLDNDEATESIVLHVEGFEDGRSVMEACEAVETPVAMYKVGKADVADFAASHTGAMAGDYAIYRAAAREYGVPVVETCQELLDAGHVLASAPVPDGPHVGVVTGQAGPGIAMTDRLKQAGARLPTLSERTSEVIEGALPDLTYRANPVDTGQPPDLETAGRILSAVAEDDSIDILLVYQLYEERVPYPVDALARIRDELDMPVLFGTNGPEEHVRKGIAAMRSHGIAAYRSPERLADAAGVLIETAEVPPEQEKGMEAVDHDD